MYEGSNRLRFKDHFFEPEERSGFLIEEKMKRVWAAEMEVLVEIDAICQANQIPYFADSGTLLGAVRHRGFIPWDDDIDIAMKRKDYERFLKVAKDLLPGGWGILHPYYDYGMCQGWRNTFSRIVNSNCVSFEKKHLERFHGCPYPVGVDIFPLDNIPMDTDEKEIYCLLQKYLYSTICLIKNRDEVILENVLKELEGLCNVVLVRDESLLSQILRLSDKVCRMYEAEEGEELILSMWGLDKENSYIYEKDWYERAVQLPFEGIQIPVPVGYHNILEKLYGKEYMTPLQWKGYHDYPFYKKWDIQENKDNG